MEQPDQPGEPVRYVGGLPDAPRPPAWPYLAMAVALMVLLVGGVLLWKPIQSIGGNAGHAIAPYSLAVTNFSWSSNEKISNVPNTFNLTVDNLDQRTVSGLTMQFTLLDRAWKILSASSANSSSEINGHAIFFSDVVPQGGSMTMSVTLVASRAMDSEIDFTLTPAHASTPARVALASGSVASALSIGARVRAPTEADASARLTAIYDPQVPNGQLAFWRIHVANNGPVTINGIRLQFPVAALSDFGFSYLPSQARVLADGLTLDFPTTLPPGGQTILVVGVTPHQSGHFQIPILVFLGRATQPMSAANGGPPLSIDFVVE
jgi:hypothetical protein